MTAMRRLATGVLALGLLVTTLSTVDGGVASASTPKGSGTISCGAIGSMTFKPPLTNNSQQTVKATVAFREVNGCTGGTPTPDIAKVSGTANLKDNSAVCATMAVFNFPITLRFRYHHLKTSTFKGTVQGYGPQSPDTFLGIGSGAVSGSYPSTDAGFNWTFSYGGGEVGNCGSGLDSVTFQGEVSNI
jgi:hypothetical protein